MRPGHRPKERKGTDPSNGPSAGTPYVLTLTGCPSCSCRPGLRCRRSLALDVDGDVLEVAGTWLPWYIIPEVYPFALRCSGARVWFPKVTCDPFCARLLGTCVRRTTRSHVLYRQHHLGTRFHDHWCGYVFCGRGLHLRSTWCGSRVHCRSPVIVRTLAQTCRNLWWFHRCSPWTSCGYASYCADSGSDVQKTVETFHSCSSWSMLLVSFGAAQWSRLLLPCSKEAFATHSGACRCVFAMSHSCDSHGASRSFVLTSNSHLYLYERVLETVVHIRRPAFHLPRQGRELP